MIETSVVVWIAIVYLVVGLILTIVLFGYPPRGKMSELALFMVVCYPFFIGLGLYAWIRNSREIKPKVQQVPLRAIRKQK